MTLDDLMKIMFCLEKFCFIEKIASLNDDIDVVLVTLKLSKVGKLTQALPDKKDSSIK